MIVCFSKRFYIGSEDNIINNVFIDFHLFSILNFFGTYNFLTSSEIVIIANIVGRDRWNSDKRGQSGLHN